MCKGSVSENGENEGCLAERIMFAQLYIFLKHFKEQKILYLIEMYNDTMDFKNYLTEKAAFRIRIIKPIGYLIFVN